LCLETFPSMSSALPRSKPNVNVTHRRGYLERAIANSFNGVAAPAFFLKDGLTSCGQLAGVGGVRGCRQTQQACDEDANSTSRPHCHVCNSQTTRAMPIVSGSKGATIEAPWTVGPRLALGTALQRRASWNQARPIDPRGDRRADPRHPCVAFCGCLPKGSPQTLPMPANDLR
jgi:hypothetical protein